MGMTITAPRMLPLYAHLLAEVALQHALAYRGVLSLASSRALVIARERAMWAIWIGGEA